MTAVRYHFVLGFDVTSPSDEVLEAHLDTVMTELLRLEPAILDPTIGADFGAKSIEVELEATADTARDALNTAASCVRSAVHTAGGSTPDWFADDPSVVDKILTDDGHEADWRQTRAELVDAEA